MGSDEDKAEQIQEHISGQGQAVRAALLHRRGTHTNSSEKLVKSLGCWYDANLRDRDQVDQIRQDAICGLESIDKSLLPGRLKLWCLQFGLLPRLMWTLTTYEVLTSKVEKLERFLSSFAKKWLGLPRCFSSIGLSGRGILELPVSSLT